MHVLCSIHVNLHVKCPLCCVLSTQHTLNCVKFLLILTDETHTQTDGYTDGWIDLFLQSAIFH